MKIKSICLSVICCLLIVGNLSASGVEPIKKKKKKGKKVAFKKGQIGAQVAAGFLLSPDYSKTDYALYGTVAPSDKSFPLFYRADFGLTDFLAAGLYFGSIKETVTITDLTNPLNIHTFEHSFKSIGLRVNYHQKLATAKLDPYAGIAIGTTLLKVAYTSDLNDLFIPPMEKAGIGFSVAAGANFYFTKNIGMFVEGGYAKSLPMLTAGLSVKF